MRPTALDITRTGNLGGKTVPMTFDPNSIAHIMSVLTDLYSDQELAVIREYSTNAYDSHIEAGNPAPIEVTTPSPLSPYFIVQDYGVGLSVDDIIDMYSKYGASTKRGTNEQTGMLGLGSKSALTYTSQFTFTAVKNGVKAIVSVGRNDDGTGKMEIIDTVSTDEPNGVQIKVPVARSNQFETKAFNFFRFWKEGTVLLNGKTVEPIKGTWVADGLLLADSLDSDYVVMGNVAYPINDEHGIVNRGYYYHHAALVAYVPIGTVAFTPNREELRYDATTKQTLKTVADEFNRCINATLNAEIAKAKNEADAFETYWKLQGKYSRLNGVTLLPKWQGQTIPDRFSLTNTQFNLSASRSRYHIHSYSSLEANFVAQSNVVFVTDVPDVQITSAHKQKMRVWVEENDYNTNYVVLIDAGQAIPAWLENVPSTTWATIKAMRLSPSNSGRGMRGVQHIQMVTESNQYPVTELDVNKPIVYMAKTESDKIYYEKCHNVAKVLHDIDPDTQVIVLGRNRWDKLVREFPQAQHVRTVLNAAWKEFAAIIPDEVKIAHVLNHREVYRKMDETRIDDPDIVNLVKIAKTDTNAYENKAQMFRNAGVGDYYWAEGVDKPKSILYTRYQLLDEYRSIKFNDHLYIYLNAAYAAMEGK